LLLNHGLIITYDDVYELVRFDIVVPNFYKYDIKPDRKLLMECLSRDVIFDYFDNMEFSHELLKCIFRECNNLDKLLNLLKGRKSILTIEHLRLACEVFNNLDIVKYLVEEHKIKPDRTCLLYACERNDNSYVIEYLFSQGVNFDLDCLETYITNMRTDFTYDIPNIFNHIEIGTSEDSTKRLVHIIEHLVCHSKMYKGCADCFMCNES
jgi:hypothetical protein